MYRCVVIGASAGGLAALKALCASLPENFNLPVVIVQHLQRGSSSYLADTLAAVSPLAAIEARSGLLLERGTIYTAPAGYHLLIEDKELLSLSVDLPVNFAIPSIDVLFESAANTFDKGLIGIILTGTGSDGALGLKYIKQNGGITIVQHPDTAEFNEMPRQAIQASQVDTIASIPEIATTLANLASMPL